MKHWTEFRTAFFVANLGSISAAARELNVHRATVLRHIDILEQELGAKVFIRDPKGYLLTDVGEDLFRVAKLTNEQLSEFTQRVRGETGELKGEFIITSVDAMSSIIAPAVQIFGRQNPQIRTRWLSSEKQMKLEYGQAHLAIRSGPKPSIDDYVVIPFSPIKFGLFASNDYKAEYQPPVTESDLKAHKFVAIENIPKSLDVSIWFNKFVQQKQIVCTSNNREVLESAIAQGVGIGFMQCHEAIKYPQLTRVLPELEWESPNWILTHGDLHRSDKVQAFLTILKSDEYQYVLKQKFKF